MDYNESIGVGCDGCESLGQGLYEQMLAAQVFLGRIRREVPDILIEICSSGGHRLEPSMMEIGNMASFSDAHEEKEIPIIAANLHRTILPMQSQIWAVIRKNDSNKRIVYSLAATFLGVMCLSGDVFECSRWQWDLIEEGIQFYRMISPIITQGYSCIYGTEQHSYRRPRGWQGVIRYAGNEERAVAIIHTFAISNPVEIALPLKNDYHIRNVFAAGSYSIDTGDKHLKIRAEESFQAITVLLVAQGETGNM